MIHGHGGNVYALARQLGCEAAEIVDMSSNINPLGMPPGLVDVLKVHAEDAGLLPEVDARAMTEGMADLLQVPCECILAGNGTTQFIYTACMALRSSRALIVEPTYADYVDACRMHGIEMRRFGLSPDSGFQLECARFEQELGQVDTVFICNPNNPTGGLIPSEPLKRVCRTHSHVRFIIDESYLPFAPCPATESMAGSGLENVIVLWSASKIFGIPGLRAGFIIASETIRQCFDRYMQPWCVNSIAQAAVRYLADHRRETLAFIQTTRDFLERERRLFQQRLTCCRGLILYPSVTSYFLMRLPPPLTASGVCDQLARRRILIRDCSNFHGLSNQFVRVALKSGEINRMAADHLADVFSD